MSDARDRILGALRTTQRRRDTHAHPGDFGAWRPGGVPGAFEGFEAMFTTAGGEVVSADSLGSAVSWFVDFAKPYPRLCLGAGVPAPLTAALSDPGPDLVASGDEHRASLGVSVARAAVAETGSLVMDARDGRRAQLLPPELVVLLRRSAIHDTLRGALLGLAKDPSAAFGLHSGPSKSADIGQVMVKGVHGPGRVIALVWDDRSDDER